MSLKIYNTLTRKKEEFIPLKEGEVKMYVCGVTVYDDCHIGHARSAIIFDVIRRYLEKVGYKVTYVRNFTDVDDKIINRANRDNKKIEEITSKYIKEYYDDMHALGVKDADIEPKATEHIQEMVDLIADLVKKGYAYENNGDVYFEVRKFQRYGKLSGRSLDELQAGARVEVNEQKKDPLDFALWKKSKPGEPEWDSPWGKGRPGWHIECSVMSKEILGDTLDIHAGGQDLIFPHHENEIAQSEASTGKPFVKYWMHNGFVNINQEKMSKSLGNFFSIKEILEKYDGETVRFFLLSTHYRSPIDFSDNELKMAKNSLHRLYNTLYNLNEFIKSGKERSNKFAGDSRVEDSLKQYEEEFYEGMDDDFNTAKALAAVFKLVNYAYLYMNLLPNINKKGAEKIYYKIKGLGEILGILQWQNFNKLEYDILFDLQKLLVELFPGKTLFNLDKEDVIKIIIDKRNESRRNKDFKTSDRIRDEFKKLGIILEDKKEGTRWKNE